MQGNCFCFCSVDMNVSLPAPLPFVVLCGLALTSIRLIWRAWYASKNICQKGAKIMLDIAICQADCPKIKADQTCKEILPSSPPLEPNSFVERSEKLQEDTPSLSASDKASELLSKKADKEQESKVCDILPKAIMDQQQSQSNKPTEIFRAMIAKEAAKKAAPIVGVAVSFLIFQSPINLQFFSEQQAFSFSTSNHYYLIGWTSMN